MLWKYRAAWKMRHAPGARALASYVLRRKARHAGGAVWIGSLAAGAAVGLGWMVLRGRCCQKAEPVSGAQSG